MNSKFWSLEFQNIAVKGLVRVLDSCLTRLTSPLDKVRVLAFFSLDRQVR